MRRRSKYKARNQQIAMVSSSGNKQQQSSTTKKEKEMNEVTKHIMKLRICALKQIKF